MGKLALMLVTAAAIAMLVVSANETGAESAKTKDAKKDAGQIAITCGGAIQRCPEGKKGYCNRWRPCKGKAAKVRRYCDAPICMTERRSKD
jgi:hypothetical protein